MKHQIICFGETLWDMLPSGRLPGGAPMNVAIHLTYNQFAPLVISRVGNDDLGKELLAFLTERGLATNYIQVGQTHLTGLVKANITDKNEVTYKILEPVAWDYIQYDREVARTVSRCDLFIYGTLASRRSTTYKTLLRYLPMAPLRVFDVNLRPPYYNSEKTKFLMRFANIIKMNHQELEEIISWFKEYEGSEEEQDQMAYILDKFQLELIIVTRGENGAAVLTHKGYWEHDGCKVEVEDTIGSGDSFLATFLSNYLQQQPTAVCLERACMIGAYVATEKGATPFYTPAEILTSFPENSLY